MTGTTARARSGLRPVFRQDRVYLGWQYAPRQPDPGPRPRRPTPPDQQQLNPGWVAAQRREERTLNRPVKLACGGALALAAALLVVWLAGLVSPLIAGSGIAACLVGAAAAGHALWHGSRTLGERIAAEQQRLALIRAEQERRLFASQDEHARAFQEWQARHEAFERQLQWHAVSLPAAVGRLDVAGGTLSGWSALVTTLGAARLSSGGEITVIDLSGGAVGQDLVALARGWRIDPLISILPGDLPRLDLGTGIGAAAMADVLSLVVDVSEERPGSRDLGTLDPGTGDPGAGRAILERLIELLARPAGSAAGQPGAAPGPVRRVTVEEVTAALRVLAAAGDPGADIEPGPLGAGQVDAIGTLFGQDADRAVLDRARELESRLRKLNALGTEPSGVATGPLRILATDQRAGAFGNQVLGSYVVAALSHILRQAPTGDADQPWRHTVILAGAERLRGDVLDRLTGACEQTRTGLVLGYRSVPAPVRGRIGRGNAAVAVMRLDDAGQAQAAAEQIGAGHRFVLSQLTGSVGASVTDTTGHSYTSTADPSTADRSTADTGTPASAGTAASAGTGDIGHLPVVGDPETISNAIRTSSAWGMRTSLAAGKNESLDGTGQHSREFAVEAGELQQLPPTAMIVRYAGIAGAPAAGGPAAADYRLVLADANPAILGLPTATVLGPDEAERPAPGVAPVSGPGAARGPATGPPVPQSPGPAAPGPAASAGRRAKQQQPVSWTGENQPPPNLGPPPDRLDWRKPRR